MSGVPLRVSTHSGQGRLNHGGHTGPHGGAHNGHGMMMTHQHQYSQGVIVTMGGGHMPSHPTHMCKNEEGLATNADAYDDNKTK